MAGQTPPGPCGARSRGERAPGCRRGAGRRRGPRHRYACRPGRYAGQTGPSRRCRARGCGRRAGRYARGGRRYVACWLGRRLAPHHRAGIDALPGAARGERRAGLPGPPRVLAEPAVRQGARPRRPPDRTSRRRPRRDPPARRLRAFPGSRPARGAAAAQPGGRGRRAGAGPDPPARGRGLAGGRYGGRAADTAGASGGGRAGGFAFDCAGCAGLGCGCAATCRAGTAGGPVARRGAIPLRYTRAPAPDGAGARSPGATSASRTAVGAREPRHAGRTGAARRNFRARRRGRRLPGGRGSRARRRSGHAGGPPFRYAGPGR